MEPGCIETYFGLKLVILGRNCSSRQCQKVSRKSGVILEVFSTSPEFGRKAEIREAVGALVKKDEMLSIDSGFISPYWSKYPGIFSALNFPKSTSSDKRSTTSMHSPLVHKPIGRQLLILNTPSVVSMIELLRTSVATSSWNLIFHSGISTCLTRKLMAINRLFR